MNRFRALGVIAYAMLVSVAYAAAAGGKIVKLEGDAVVERKGERLPASESFALQRGDTLTVADKSKAQVHFEDDSVFALPANSSLRVDDFRMPRKDAGGSAIFSLLRGGLRTITGLISKGSHDKYEIRTSMVTIGVRGTAYAALICEGDCTANGKYKAGVYVKTDSGTVILTNPGGQLAVKAGETAYVESKTTAPVKVKISPFNDPAIAAEFGIDADFNININPPRIEPEPPASPS